MDPVPTSGDGVIRLVLQCTPFTYAGAYHERGIALMTAKTSRSKTPAAKKSTARSTTPRSTPARSAKDAFVEGVIVRGEAAEPCKDGSLPTDATHVKKRGPNGQTTIARARFKLV